MALIERFTTPKGPAVRDAAPNTLGTASRRSTSRGVVCNFLSEDVIKKVIRTDTPGSRSREWKMDKLINTLEHAATAELVRVQQFAGCLVCNSRVAG